jgi:hypothetical protein
LKVVYSMLALSLALISTWQWRDWPPPAPEPSEAGPSPPAASTSLESAQNPLDSMSPLGDIEEYAIVTERPLFFPDRRPPSEEPEEETPVEPEQPSDLDRMDLNAVLITPSESSVWVRDPSKKELIRLRLGDDLGGWSVKEILADRVLLERQGAKDTLVLRDYKNMPPPQRKPTAREQRRQTPQAAAERKALGQPPNRNRDDGNRNPKAVVQPPGARKPRAAENARQLSRQR